MTTLIGDLLPKADPDDALLGGLCDGRVTRVVGDRLYFTVDDMGTMYEFGPAPYPRPAVATAETGGGAGEASFAAHSHNLRTPAVPPVGTQIVAGFVAGDVDRPRVLTFYGWPA